MVSGPRPSCGMLTTPTWVSARNASRWARLMVNDMVVSSFHWSGRRALYTGAPAIDRPPARQEGYVMELIIRPCTVGDVDVVVALWERCNLVARSNDPRRDIELKMRVQPQLLLVGTTGGRVVATVMAGYDG